MKHTDSCQRGGKRGDWMKEGIRQRTLFLRVKQNIGCIFLPQNTLTDKNWRHFLSLFFFDKIRPFPTPHFPFCNIYKSPYQWWYLGSGLLSCLIFWAMTLFWILSHFYSETISKCMPDFLLLCCSDKGVIFHYNFFLWIGWPISGLVPLTKWDKGAAVTSAFSSTPWCF